ncbi:MAG: alanine dehydrogenase, partial [Candidatus Omnitrophota bacterium]
MDIGIAAENRPQEKRVIMRPDELKEIVSSHTVYVEQGAGKGVGIDDVEYERVGAHIVDAQKVYSSSLVIRLKEPKEDELAMMRPNSAIMSMMHLSSNPPLRSLLKKYKIVAIAMDEVKNS